MSVSAKTTRSSPRFLESFNSKIKALPGDSSPSNQWNSHKKAQKVQNGFLNSFCAFSWLFPCSSTKQKSQLKQAPAGTAALPSGGKSLFLAADRVVEMAAAAAISI